ncbi:MAG: MAPEG family protein [Allosphingosinicella sp.]|uniref:MAPEG family protein n=1 Tax=Allosphingosinicella sp. TaxID=2823234 RepID=UPI003927AC76
MDYSPILAPVVALVAWSIVVMFWMVATRLPAMKRKGIDLKTARGGRPGVLDGVLDEEVQWKAHNYIHLMEQPTLFYAICLALALMGAGGGLNEALAWAYVVFRVAHSIVQGTVNIIRYRFLLFLLASLALIGMTGSAIVEVLARW